MAVRFLKLWRNYNPGEIAGFDEPNVERNLVNAGLAEFVGGSPVDKMVSNTTPGKTAPRRGRKIRRGDGVSLDVLEDGAGGESAIGDDESAGGDDERA